MTSAVQLSRLLRGREMTVTSVAESLAQRLALDPHHAWAAVDPEYLMAQARTLDGLGDEVRRAMPLFGVPVGIKDAFDTSGLPTAYGSPIYDGHRPRRDAEVVRRLSTAGAMVAGKTRCAEFSWMTAPETVNPLDPRRTPGGSSSGSAASVAAGEVPLATGTQTAGSVIRPGSYCGVLGFKPTFGTFPRAGALPMSSTLDTVGVFARELADLILVSEALWGVDPQEVTIRSAIPLLGAAGERTPRLAFSRTPFWQEIEPEARSAIDEALARARELGVELEGVELGEEFRELTEAQRTIQWVEGAAALREELEHRPERLSPALQQALREGRQISEESYEAALTAARRSSGPLRQMLAGFDGVLVPSALGAPPEGLAFTGDPLFCRAFTLAGVPCVSLPLARTTSGLPAGLQLVGGPRRDRRLLGAARWLLEKVGAQAEATTGIEPV
jgi:Asp-tRNA(Asn)/Glu-tRNA(Gln) amidotransferase A subunit family amidase